MPKNLAELALDNVPFLHNSTKNKNDDAKLNDFSIIEETIEEYISQYFDINAEGVVLVNSRKKSDFEVFLNIDYSSIINFHRINDIRYINKFFENVNALLPIGGYYVGTFESSEQRKFRILNKYPKIYAYPFYFGTFILKRIFPKWPVTKKIYFFMTRGMNRYLPLAEVLGRLISCGFEIIDYTEKSNRTYFISQKIQNPAFDTEASYGPLFGMKRIGKNGKKIKVYKVRTMHPFAEYLQEYIFNKNKLSKNGKFKDDFRITTWGKVFRKWWIDEVPMIFNLLKGDLKLVGVRPLSEHYLSLYPSEIKKLRLNTKPGLLPPYYADLPKSFDEIVKSEEEYLKQYFKNPIKTDLMYLWKIYYNIFFGKARSS